jgi:hypothetical protein
MKNITSILALALLTAACSKGIKGDPCDAKAIAGITSSSGKRVAFTGCTFQSQGNDVVAFGDATGKGPSIDCKLKGGDAAVTEFRHAAMKLSMSKLRLDVQGTVDGKAMTECEITAHE